MLCRFSRRRPCPAAAIARALAMSIFGGALFNAVFAQSIPQVVVTGARSEQSITDALASTTVLTRQDIRDSQAPDLPTLLRSAAGMEVTQNGGFGNNATVSMRGGNANHTLILLDGMRINSATTGQTALERLTLDQIERVEIVRGNVSALYGSEAVGGVIQLFSRQGGGTPALGGSLTTGARGTLAGNLDFGGKVGDTRFHIGAAGLHTANFSSINPQTTALTRTRVNPDDDGYRNTTLNASASHTLNARNEIGMRFFGTRGLINFDSSSAGQLTTNVHQTQNATSSLALYSKNRILDAWRSTFTVSKSTDSSDQTLNYKWDGHIRTDQRQWTWQNEVTLAPTHKLLFTAETLSQRAESQSSPTTALPNAFVPARKVNSLLAGYNGSVERAEFQLNLRADRYSDFGSVNTYFAAGGYHVTDEWKLIIQQSTAFKAPTFNDLYFPGFGTPTLLPERVKSRDFGAQWAGGAHLLRITRFRSDYVNLIQASPVFATNVARARVNGWEGNYTSQWSGFDLRANVTLQDPVSIPENAVTGPQLRRRAQMFGNIGVYRSIGAWRLGADVFSTDKRVDTLITSTTTRAGLSSYNLVTLTARYNFNKEMYVAAKLDNAGNALYQTAQGFNSPPRGFFLTFGYQPK